MYCHKCTQIRLGRCRDDVVGAAIGIHREEYQQLGQHDVALYLMVHLKMVYDTCSGGTHMATAAV